MDADSFPIPESPDLLVIGGGAVGLWCAIRGAQQGLSVVLAEKGRVGQGASGGILGALMPHQPGDPGKDPKKAFQLEALLSLETEIAGLERATGIETGYRRCGRIQPLHDKASRDRADHLSDLAAAYWPRVSPDGKVIRCAVQDTWNGRWLNPSFAPCGIADDSLSARIEPRSYVKALHALALGLGVAIIQNRPVLALSAKGEADLGDGSIIRPGHVIVAAGTGSFPVAEPLTGEPLGSAVKGQAALLQPRYPLPPDIPILFDSGLYVIAHESGLAAVGSTSERDWKQVDATDARLDEIIVRAIQMCPLLDGAHVIERWAGIRPKGVTRNPLIGPLPAAPSVIMCTGGYKITLGIAHRMADAALHFVTEQGAPPPDAFRVEAHLRRSVRQ